jgi:predicted amidohydrolase
MRYRPSVLPLLLLGGLLVLSAISRPASAAGPEAAVGQPAAETAAPRSGSEAERGGETGPQRQSPVLAVVQYAVEPELIDSLERFEEETAARMTQALGESGRPALVVLPEYSNVFPALVPLAGRLAEEGSWEPVAEELQQEEGSPLGVQRFFLRRAPAVRRWMDRFYGGWAEEHEVWLLAGTYFAAEQGELRNRAVLYGPRGEVCYEQDKVYLTPFEKNAVHLSPGTAEEARIFGAAGLRCALTICRDSFFEQWEERFAGAELWIDLKANGERWSEENRQRFRRALPERIAGSGVPWGLTVTLVGEMYGLLWEGPSSLVHAEEDAPAGWITLWRAPAPDEPAAQAVPLSLYPSTW